MRITPKNWQSFQHYKDRAPPWIKLHKSLLDDFEFQSLPVASRALAPMLWLLASEHPAGEIAAAPDKLAFRLRMLANEVKDALHPLVEAGFFIVVEHGDSDPLAERKRDAMPETEGETEKKPLRVVADTGAFGRFWKTWPSTERKVAKAKCLDAWKRRHLDARADQIIAHVEAMKGTDTWQRGFEPAPLTYLNQRRWEDSVASVDQFRGAI